MEKTKSLQLIEERDLTEKEVREILKDLKEYVRRAAYPVKHPAFSRIWSSYHHAQKGTVGKPGAVKEASVKVNAKKECSSPPPVSL